MIQEDSEKDNEPGSAGEKVAALQNSAFGCASQNCDLA